MPTPTPLPKITGSGTTPLLFQTFSFTISDPVNGNDIVSPTGDEVLVAWNTDGSNPHYATVLGVSGEATVVIPESQFAFIGRIPQAGFLQADGTYHVISDSTAVLFAVLVLPS